RHPSTRGSRARDARPRGRSGIRPALPLAVEPSSALHGDVEERHLTAPGGSLDGSHDSTLSRGLHLGLKDLAQLKDGPRTTPEALGSLDGTRTASAPRAGDRTLAGRRW